MVVASHPLPFSREKKLLLKTALKTFSIVPLIQVPQFKLTNDIDQGTTLDHISLQQNQTKVSICSQWSRKKPLSQYLRNMILWTQGERRMWSCARTDLKMFSSLLLQDREMLLLTRFKRSWSGSCCCWGMFINVQIQSILYYTLKENFMGTKMQALQFEILISGFTLICMLGENSGLIEDHFWNFSGLLGFIGWVGDWSVVRFTPRGLASDQVSANFFKWISMWQYRCRYSISDIQL